MTMVKMTMKHVMKYKKQVGARCKLTREASKQGTCIVKGRRNSRKKKNQLPQYKTTKHLNNKKIKNQLSRELSRKLKL